MSTKDTTTTVVARPTRGHGSKNSKNRHTRLMSAYLIRVARAHNLPLLEAPARGTTIDPVRTSHKVSVVALVSFDMVAP